MTFSEQGQGEPRTLREVWRREIAIQRERISIPLWRVGLGSGFAAAAGNTGDGWGFWIGLVLCYVTLLGPWQWAKLRRAAQGQGERNQ